MILQINCICICNTQYTSSWLMQRVILGSGTSSNVYKTEINGMQYAMKEIFFQTQYQKFKAYRQQNVLASLNHPNIVRFSSSKQIDNRLIIYSQMLEKQINNQDNLEDIQTIYRWLRDVAYGLLYLHNKGYIHRDIKPANLLLSFDGRVKIIDFGLTIEVKNLKQQNNKSVGSPIFMAPEVFLDLNYDYRADIYSLGATFYYLIEQRYPYYGNTQQQYWLNTCNNRLKFYRNDESLLQMQTIVMKMLQKDPKKRISIQKIIEKTNRFLQNQNKTRQKMKKSNKLVYK